MTGRNRCKKLQAIFLSATMLVLLLTPMLADEKVPKVAPDAKAPADSIFDKPLMQGIEYVYSDRYPESLALFDSLKKVYPNHPAPYFYTAATYQAWMGSYRINTFQSKLEENVQQAIDKGNALLEKHKDNPWLNFYVGAAYGYRAFNRFRNSNWIGAFFDGRKGIGNFEESLKKEETLYDVYLGLGSYYYWRTARSKFIRAVAFWMSDKREEGLKQIEFSIKHGRYCPPESVYGLVVALYDHGEYDRALEIFNADYIPQVQKDIITGLYLQGLLMAEKENWGEVNRLFSEVLAQLEAHQYQSLGYQAECKYWLALAAGRSGDATTAKTLLAEALKLSEQRNKDKELEGPIYEFDAIKERMENLRSELAQ